MEFLNFVGNVKFAYPYDGDIGRQFGDMISFLFGCPKLRYKSGNLTKSRLISLCLEDMLLHLPDIFFGSSNSVGDGPDFFEISNIVQSFFLGD